MFDENVFINEIYETVKNVINFAVESKKKYDKKFLHAVVSYQREEEDTLLEILSGISSIYTAAIQYASSEDCELWFEELYCVFDDKTFSGIHNFCNQYTKTKSAEYTSVHVKEVFGSVCKLPKTVELLMTINWYKDNITEKEDSIIRMVINYINNLH